MHRKIAGLLALTGAVCALAAAARPESQQDPGEPCCGIVAIDQAKGIVTVKDKSGRFTFLATLANPKSAAGLRTGLAVGLSNETKTLILPAKAGRAKQNLGLSAVQFGGLTYPGAPGAIGSAVTSSGGTFKREPNNKRCPQIKETSTQQCVLTHVTEGVCEYYCVNIVR